MTEFVNPYAHLITQTRALLHTEARMGPDLRRPFSWMLRADFLDTFCTVVKGGANTMIISLGERRLDPCYPHDALSLLTTLRAQPFPLYVVLRADGSQRRFHLLSEALDVRPRDGDRIGGLSPVSRGITHVGRRNTVGELKWIPRRKS